MYELGDLDDSAYEDKRREIAAAVAQLDSLETPAVRKASQMLKNIKGFAWQKASPEKKALAFQSMFEGLFVSAVDDKIVAVIPIPELRLFMQERIYVRRKPAGWQIGSEGVDYDSPNDWSITFTASLKGLAVKLRWGWRPWRDSNPRPVA